VAGCCVRSNDSLGETQFEFLNQLLNCVLTSEEVICCLELVNCLSEKSKNRILNQLSTSPVNSEVTCLEIYAATKFSKIFSGRQPRQSVKNVVTFQGLTVSPS
jgi:hypothetical protein